MGVGAAGILTGSSAFANIIIPKRKEKLGVALVGLGYYSRDLLAPALQLTQHCELKGIVTGSPDKVPQWQKRYGIADKHVYNYENMNRIADNPDIDVIYIVLPTGLHAKYAVKAANTGKHVWCEKPMARTAEECQQWIEFCESKGYEAAGLTQGTRQVINKSIYLFIMGNQLCFYMALNPSKWLSCL